jgi:alpha-galactosidase
MGILYDKNNQIFHLQGKAVSYIFQVIEGYLVHVYWGKKIRHLLPTEQGVDVIQWGNTSSNHPNRLGLVQVQERCSFHSNPVQGKKQFSLDTLAQEFPQYGTSDQRHPVYQAELNDGTRITELTYESHQIIKGKPTLNGLPSVYAEATDEAETLIVTLVDTYSGLRAHLSYTVFEHTDAITRSVRYENTSDKRIVLNKAGSASIDLATSHFELIALPGAHVRERHINRTKLAAGNHRLESRRGSSSHQMNPFAALVHPTTTEDHGDVYSFSLVYSGNFAIETEIEQFGMTRVTVGINSFDFAWHLDPKSDFQAPEVVFVYSPNGLGGMSRTYHDLYRTRLCRGVHRDAVRPILINNWEATYFNFNADKIESIAKAGAELGIELFVLDDGWFGSRNNDDSSLGDWVVDTQKLPNGLDDLANRITNLGMQFGLWFEPEMVSPNSDLYRQHPDWCLHVPGRRRTEARDQLILDLSRQDVVDYLFESISAILKAAPISYVKWDMNRNFTEAGSALLEPSRQKETAHRYMLGLYQLLERIVTAFPDILFESCSGGGGRFDPGMLYYMPQTWTSDNTDAVERLKIQYGTSLVYPLSTMGAHVSAVPNHQVDRITSLKMRGDVAMSGNFGYELDLTHFTEEEREIVKGQTADYKEIRELVQQGHFYRLLSPFEGNETAWMVVSQDRREAVVFYFRTLAQPNAPLQRLKLNGLNPDFDYVFAGNDEPVGGDLLMQHGWAVPYLKGDFASVWFKLTAR